ncbi:MAG TPA: AAA family ATPase [Steroidobacteraceae bacterium]|nr:AAA family ATPase [Steroidobacteraceae bacterium]
MSIVEKALNKLQSASRPASAAPAAPVAAARPAGAPGRLADTSAHRVIAPTRVVPFNSKALRAAGLLPPEAQERQISQQFRQIKRPLVAAIRDSSATSNGHVVMVASALPGEGKTFTSVNLAVSLAAEKDVRVVLVDGDVAKPHVSRELGAADEPGLLDVLGDKTLDVESFVLPTDVPNLSLLPAGKRAEDATELLASARMVEVIGALRRRDEQRIVLFDSPPLLLTTESHAVAQVAGEIVLVVKAGVTPHGVLQDAIGRLGGHPSVSLVLNQSVVESNAGYYYVAYGDAGRAGSEV